MITHFYPHIFSSKPLQTEIKITRQHWVQSILQDFSKHYNFLIRFKKKNDSLWLVTLPKGLSEVEYLLQFQKIVIKKKAKLLFSEVISKSKKHYFISSQLQHQKQNAKIRFRMSSEYLGGLTKIAFLFYDVDSLTHKDFLQLGNQSYKKNFVLTSTKITSLLQRYLSIEHENQIYLKLNMESSRYPYLKPGKLALFIHYNEKEVKQVLETHLSMFPQAKGFVTSHGDRSMQHLPLLTKFFKYLKHKNLLFLNMMNNSNRLANEASQKINYPIFHTPKRKFDLQNFSKYMDQKVIKSLTKGYEIIAFPYSSSLIDSIAHYTEKPQWKSKKIDLVHISQIHPHSP